MAIILFNSLMEYYVGVEEEAVTTIRLLHRCWDSFGGGIKTRSSTTTAQGTMSRVDLR